MIKVQKLPASLEAAAKAFYLPILSDVPAGCKLILNNTRMHEPFLKMGEFAVVDVSDHRARDGELFAIRQSNGPVIWQVALTTDPGELQRRYQTTKTIVWLRPLRRVDIEDAIRKADLERHRYPGRIPVLDVHLSDGPFGLDHFNKIVIGHVMGVFRLPKIVGMPS